MTAINVIVQERARAVFLLTDTAVINPDGRVAAFASKVIPLCIPGQAWGAIAATGNGGMYPRLKARLAKLRPRSADELLSEIPAIFRGVVRSLAEDGSLAASGSAEGAAAVGMFDRTTGRPSAFVIAGDTGPNPIFPRETYRERYALEPVRKFLTASDRPLVPYGVDVCDPRQWHPYRDAAALIEAQRDDPAPSGMAEKVGIGGKAVLTRIDASGIASHIVKRWPDRVGELIDPSRVAPIGWRERLAGILPGRLQVAA